LPTNLRNFTQKDLTAMKIFLKVSKGGASFLKHPVPGSWAMIVVELLYGWTTLSTQ